MNTTDLSPIKLNITTDNCKEFENIIKKLHQSNTNPFFYKGSLSILKVTLDNYEEIVTIVDRLYRINAILFSDWSLIKFQLLNKHIDLAMLKTTRA